MQFGANVRIILEKHLYLPFSHVLEQSQIKNQAKHKVLNEKERLQTNLM